MEFLGNAHPPTRKPLSNWGEVMCQTKPSTYSLHPPCSLRCQLSVERGKWKRLSPNRSLRSTGECRLLITFSAPQVKRLFNPHVTCCNLLHQESTIISTRVCIKIRDTSHATTRRNIDKSTQAARKGIQTRLASSRTVSCHFSGTTGARVGGFGRSSHTEPEEVRLGWWRVSAPRSRLSAIRDAMPPARGCGGAAGCRTRCGRRLRRLLALGHLQAQKCKNISYQHG